MIKVTCSDCNYSFDVPDEVAGKKAICPECDGETLVSRGRAAESSLPIEPVVPEPVFSSGRNFLAVWIILFAGAVAAVGSGALYFFGSDASPDGDFTFSNGRDPESVDATGKNGSDPDSGLSFLYKLLEAYRVKNGTFPENLNLLFPDDPEAAIEYRDVVYIPEAGEISSSGKKYPLLAGKREGYYDVVFIGGENQKLTKTEYDSILKDLFAALEKPAEDSSVETNLEDLLERAAAFENAGKQARAIDLYLKLKEKGFSPESENENWLDEKIRTLRFIVRLRDARKAFENGSDDFRKLYAALDKDFPLAAETVRAELKKIELSQRAQDLSSAGCFDRAVEVLKLISEESTGDDSLFWKRYAYGKIRLIENAEGDDAAIFKRAVEAAQKGGHAIALRLYETLINRESPSEWTEKAARARSVLVREMPYGRRFRDKSDFILPGERAMIGLALSYLAKNQNPSGGWSSADTAGAADLDAGVTALALTAFMGEGCTHFSGPYAEVVKKAVLFLISAQDSDGFIGRSFEQTRWLYNHALATAALSELLAMTADRSLEDKVRAAVDALKKAQDKGLGWKYYPAQGSDASVTSMVAWALAAARSAGIEVDQNLPASCRRYLRSVTEGPGASYEKEKPRTDSLFGNSPPQGDLPVLSAQVAWTRLLLGESVRTVNMPGVIELVRTHTPPAGSLLPGKKNYLFWYYGSLAIASSAPEHERKEWRRRMVSLFADRQVEKGPLAGAWPSDGMWCEWGGTIYASAMSVLTLQTPYNRPADFFGED